MYKHILIPTDGSELAHKAVMHGLSLAKAVTARVTLLSVQPSFMSDRFGEYAKESNAQAASVLNQIAVAAMGAGVQCETMQVTHNHPHEAIVAIAKDKGCDIIVMATHGRSGIVVALPQKYWHTPRFRLMFIADRKRYTFVPSCSPTLRAGVKRSDSIRHTTRSSPIRRI